MLSITLLSAETLVSEWMNKSLKPKTKDFWPDAGFPRCSPDVSECCACLWNESSDRRGIAGLRQSGSRCRHGGFAERPVGGFQPLGQQWAVQHQRVGEARAGHAGPTTAPGSKPWSWSPSSCQPAHKYLPRATAQLDVGGVIGGNCEMISISVSGVCPVQLCSSLFFPCDHCHAGRSELVAFEDDLRRSPLC